MEVFRVHSHASPNEAPNYELPEFKGVTITDCHVVGKGTVNNRPTVDIVFVDEQGQKYVAMTTGAMIRALSVIVESKDPQTGELN